MELKNFGQLKKEELEQIIDIHYNYWCKFNPSMIRENTENKFKNLYTLNQIPIGIALFDKNNLVVFCVIKKENLKKYPQFFPWISDLMIFEEYKNKGYGTYLVKNIVKMLKNKGFEKVYVWTDQAPNFYKKLGFKFLQKIEKNEGGEGELYVI